MGKVIDKSGSPEAKQDLIQENKDVEGRKRDATNALLATLDLPEDKVEKKEEIKDKETPDKEVAEKKETDKEEQVEEFQSDKSDEEILAADDKDLTKQELAYKKQLQEQGDEELIPKSKVEKRFRQLTEKIRKLETAQVKSDTSVDSDRAKLEQYSLDKLTELRQKVRQEIREGNRAISKGTDVDEKRLDDLDILADKIDESIRTYPARFSQKQVELYNQSAQEITADLAEELPEKEMVEACAQIKNLAEDIYSRYPKLQQSEEGQALALQLAKDHWEAKREFSLGKSETSRLKQANKKLLRKISLDKNIVNADKGRRNLEDLRQKAGRGGTDQDRVAYVENDPRFNVDALIPDEFKTK